MGVMGGDEELRDFLISYTAADVERARWISEVLQSIGYTTFFQDDDFTPGDNRPAWIEQVVTHSERTVAVLSPAYLKSKYGTAEWQFAWDEDPHGRQGKLIVVKVSDCVPPGMLRLRPGIDLAGLTDETEFKQTLISKIEDVFRRGVRHPDLRGRLADEAIVGDTGPLAAKRMRMLRIGAGLTAGELAQKSGREGISTLNRGTIAKIETNRRKIRVREVSGVARIFGLTSADLLDRAGPTVILCYAQQDRGVGRDVSAWLADRGFRVLVRDRTAPVDQVIHSSAEVTDAAQAFIALISPAFLTSGDCMAELDLAARRHQRNEGSSYIQALRVGDASDLDMSRFSAYQPINLTPVSGLKKEEALSQLGSRILRSRGNQRTSLNTPGSADWQGFLDRRDELDKVLNGLDSPFGPHFWLVMSPPGVGKTTFLARLAGMADEETAWRWVTKTVDLRATATDGVVDAMALVGTLFAVGRAAAPTDGLRAVAREIIKAGRPHLCILDSAELLPLGTVAALRGHLSQIYRFVQDRGDPKLKLAFVAASRRDDGWRGVTPSPRLAVLPLAQFDIDAVQEGGSDLAARMGLQHSPGGLRHEAALVHNVTEGVPALVHRGLQWISAEEGLQVERLNHPEVFNEIIRPFIEGQLLARDSMLPDDTGHSVMSSKRLLIIERVIKCLVPYRFFTLSHLRRLSDDTSLATSMEEAHWSSNEVWQKIGACSLLMRPLDEPWRKFHPAIRRLLFRYFYTVAERAEAHRDARAITEQWSTKQSGTDQIIGMIDCIWHEAARLRLIGSAQMGDSLIRYVNNHAQTISESRAYSEIELRAYAAERARGDDELRGELVDIDGLFEKLIMILGGTPAPWGMP